MTRPPTAPSNPQDDAPPPPRRATPAEIVVCLAILGVLAGIAIPQILDAREKARVAVCDNLYVALSGDGWNHAPGSRAELVRACGGVDTMEHIVDCALTNHTDEDNPRNRNQVAYTSAPITPARSCQVRLEPVGTNGIRFSQFVTSHSTSSRSFSVTID